MTSGLVIMALVSMMAISLVGAAESQELLVTRSYPAPLVERHEGYDEVRVGELPAIRRRHTPFLPADPFAVLIPHGFDLAGIEVRADRVQRSETKIFPAISQEPKPLTAVRTSERDDLRARDYALNTAWVDLVETCVLRGYRIARFIAHPARILADHRLETAGALAITLRLEVARDELLPCPAQSTRTFVGERVLNPETLATCEPAYSKRKLTLDYLIVGPADWAATVDPLIQHHEAGGLRCRYESLEEIRQRCGPGPDVSLIRQRVGQLYREEGIRYLLLLGGEPVLLDRRVYARPWSGAKEVNMPADLYFAAVEPAGGAYDFNGNHRFGEPDDGAHGGEVDLAAEVAVGRFPVRSQAALSNAVTKALRHQQALNPSGSAPRVLGLSEHLGFHGTLKYADPLVNAWVDTLSEAQEVAATMLSDAQGGWNRKRLDEFLASGVDAVLHAGHGTYGRVMKIAREAAGMLPDHPPFFLYTQACFAGAFDRHRSFAELMLGSASGASAIVGGAREGWQTKDAPDSAAQRFALSFWREAARNPQARLGDLMNAARHDARWDPQADGMRWTTMHMQLLGDPAQPLFAKARNHDHE